MSSTEREPVRYVPVPPAAFRGSLNPTGRDQDDRSSLHHVGWITYIKAKTLVGWTDIRLWQSAFVEVFGTMLLAYLSALNAVTFGGFNPIYIPNWIGITNVVIIALFIFACSQTSGGHLNPLITFSTMLTGLTPFPRAILYMLGQTLGGAVAGGLIRGTLGLPKIIQYRGISCFYEHYPASENNLSRGQAFILEMTCSIILLLLAYGCALDPRFQGVIGPLLGPILVAMSVGIITFATSGLTPHYFGASMNPTRCFAFAVATNDYSNQWLYWFGPAVASIVWAFVYYIAPVYETKVGGASPNALPAVSKERDKERDKEQSTLA